MARSATSAAPAPPPARPAPLHYGISGAANYRDHSYGFPIPGGYTLKAGSGHTGGKGVIGTVTGTAVATANGGNASAVGYRQSGVIQAGYTTGTIGTVTGKATATAEAGNAFAAGIDGSRIVAGLGYDGYGTIGNVTGLGYATSTTGNAHAYGINDSTISAGLNDGVIGNVTGTATATVLGTNQESCAAIAAGIVETDIYAGYSGVYGKIGAVTGTATAKIHSSYENGAATATATGLWTTTSTPRPMIKGYALDNGTGIIGIVTGTGAAYAYGYQVSATGYGIIRYVSVNASNGDLGTGTIGGVYGYGIAKAVGNDLGATASARGINGAYIAAGTGLNSVGKITGEVYGTADATATSVGRGPRDRHPARASTTPRSTPGSAPINPRATSATSPESRTSPPPAAPPPAPPTGSTAGASSPGASLGISATSPAPAPRPPPPIMGMPPPPRTASTAPTSAPA